MGVRHEWRASALHSRAASHRAQGATAHDTKEGLVMENLQAEVKVQYAGSARQTIPTVGQILVRVHREVPA